MNLPEPECRLGYAPWQIEEFFDSEIEDGFFWEWMRGQTMAICDGRRFNHETLQYEESCGGVAHGGPIVYPWDLERYLAGFPVID